MASLLVEDSLMEGKGMVRHKGSTLVGTPKGPILVS